MSILIRDILAVLPEDGSYAARTLSVGVDGDKIAFVGEAPADFRAEAVIDGRGRLLIPGLVNAHTHAYMTVFRNCADDLKFSDWLFGHILPMEDALTAEDAYWGTLLGCMEMLRTGTTSFLDMYIFTDTVPQAAAECGIRAVLSRGLTGGAEDVKGGERRLREALAEHEKWRDTESLSFMLAPHAPYSCDEGYLREVAQTAKSLGIGLHIHVSESRSEVEGIREKYGCLPAELLDRAGILTDKTVAAHCVYLTELEMELFAARGVSVATNPVSNMKLANGFAPVPKLLEKGVNVCLGTDGAASNNRLDMLRELSVLTIVHKGAREDPLAVSARQGLKLATVNGARALGLDAGEIRVGMKADLAVLSMAEPWFSPRNDPVAALSYSASGSDVETVIVNGKIVMKNREFTGIDRERVLYETEKIRERLGAK